VEGWALETAFGGGGQALVSSLGTLSGRLGPALDLWREVLGQPAFTQREVEVWRTRELDAVRRRREAPAGVAYARFNELMFGDHPIGWRLAATDLTPDRINPAALAAVHRATLCAENLIVGVSGDTDWRSIRPHLRRVIDALPRCPQPLGLPPEASVRRTPETFVLPASAAQSTIVLGVGSALLQADAPDFFAAQVANTILGGSGLTSRLSQRLRTQAGLAYSASTIWTTPTRGEGIFAAVVQTRADATQQAIDAMRAEIEAFHRDGPTQAEVDRTVRELTNAYAFAFRDARQVVVRRLAYLREGLPEDWLERRAYRIGLVTRDDVTEAFRTYVNPGDFTALIVGDTAQVRLDEAATLLPNR